MITYQDGVQDLVIRVGLEGEATNKLSSTVSINSAALNAPVENLNGMQRAKEREKVLKNLPVEIQIKKSTVTYKCSMANPLAIHNLTFSASVLQYIDPPFVHIP